MFMSLSNSLAGQDAGGEALSSTPGTGPGKINYYLKVRSELEKSSDGVLSLPLLWVPDLGDRWD